MDADHYARFQQQHPDICALVEAGGRAIAIADEAGRIVHLNHPAEKMLGYSLQERYHHPLHTLGAAGSRAVFDSMLSVDSPLGGRWAQAHFRCRNGRLVQVEFACDDFRLEDGVFYVVPFRDVSHEQQRDAQLLQETSHLQSVLNTVLDGVITMGADGRIRSFNKAASQIFGYQEQDVIGHRIERLMPSPYADEHQQYVNHYLSGGAPKVIGQIREVQARRSNGEVFPVELSVSEMNTGSERVFVGTIRDISDRKRADKLKDEFLATMSHEIRTPLNGIVGMLGLLSHSGELGERNSHYIDIALRSADSLLTIINDILDYSKIEANQLNLEILATDIRQVVEEVTTPLLTRAEEKGINLNVEIVDTVPTRVNTDPTRFKQILTNLLANAVKFTEHGQVEVTIQPHTSKRTPGVKELLIRIKDTGIGIQPDALPTLFNRFTQADASTTRRFGGTGLGLAISKKLTERLGGSIGVSSQPGKGSEFWFTLVDAEASSVKIRPSAPKKPLEQNAAILKGKRVLVVEDNAINQEVISSLLEEMAVTFDLAENGEECLDALHAAPLPDHYAAILMDCQMPGMDGYTATGEIRAGACGPELASIPIIALTANAMDDDRERALGAGMSDFITKPVEPEALANCLCYWLANGAGEHSGASRPMADRLGSWNKDDLLRRVRGKPERAAHLISMWLRRSADYRTRLLAHGKACNYVALSEIAHEIKGVTGNLGATTCAAIAQELDNAARNEQPQATGELLKSFESQLLWLEERLKFALENEL